MSNVAVSAGSPAGLFVGLDVLVVGVEPDPFAPRTQTRVYLGHRGRGVYFALTGEDADEVRRAWDGSFHGHLYMARANVPLPLLEATRWNGRVQ